MIPKTIHYCWFGGKPLPRLAVKCIESWRKFLPDYEIKEWNESNFDVRVIPYTEAAYKYGKFAFVSDYARYWILFREGGIYFDTDVEVIRPMDDIIERGPFLGIEKSRDDISVNPGLGMGAEQGLRFYKEMLQVFENREQDAVEPPPLLVKETTRLLRAHGFVKSDSLQTIDGITVYPNDFFNPMDDYTGKIHITPNTRSIHRYAKSWIKNYGPLRNTLTHWFHRLKARRPLHC